MDFRQKTNKQTRIPRMKVNKVTPVSMGYYPLSVFNRNSTLKERKKGFSEVRKLVARFPRVCLAQSGLHVCTHKFAGSGAYTLVRAGGPGGLLSSTSDPKQRKYSPYPAPVAH